MTLEHLLEVREKQGLEQGKEQLASLVQKLLADKRLDDIQRLTEDPEYREQLLKEYSCL